MRPPVDLLRGAAARLADAGIEEPMREARILLAAAMNVRSAALIDREPTRDEWSHFEALLARRLMREPVAYILGRREFWSLDFEVSHAVLIPRPDSEALIEEALKRFKDWPAERVLDLGTGSGCLLISLLTEWPEASGVGVDQSADALTLAKRNAERLGVAARANFVRGDWTAGISERFDLVISNPPYISDAEFAALDRDVSAFEPAAALKGGADGLDPLRRIAAALPDVLNPRGFAIIEIGAGQAKAAGQIVAESGLNLVSVVKDLAGYDRAVVARLPQETKG